MEVFIKHTIDIATSDACKLSLANEISGSSANTFEQSEDSLSLGEKFEIKEYEHKIFTLVNGNTFSEDVIALLESSASDIIGLEVFAFKFDTNKKILPIRFKVEIKLTGMGSQASMGTTTHFSMQNLIGSTIEQLTVSAVEVEADVVASLVILAFSKNKNAA